MIEGNKELELTLAGLVFPAEGEGEFKPEK